MKLQLFQIILDKTEAVYAPGDSVSGHVDIVVKKDIKLRQCELIFNGLARVFWMEGDGEEITVFAANEEYFKFEQQLLVKGAKEEAILPGGSHSFPFNFQLPTNLPTTFASRRGWVSYCLEAVIDETWWKFKDNCKLPIAVVTPVDYNDNPELLNVKRVDGSKKVCCCCCASHINASFEVQRQTYCAGETILHTGEITNGSSRDVVPIIELIYRVIWKAVGKTEVGEDLVCKIVEPKVSGESSYRWNQKPLLIPSESVPVLTHCNIIESTYIVRLHVDVPWTKDYRVDIPISVGTIPANVASQHDIGDNTQSGVVTQQPSVSPIVPAVSYTNNSAINLGFTHDQSGGHKEEGASDDTFTGNTGVPM